MLYKCRRWLRDKLYLWEYILGNWGEKVDPDPTTLKHSLVTWTPMCKSTTVNAAGPNLTFTFSHWPFEEDE